MAPRTRLAVDIGGTFTDLVLELAASSTLSLKLLTTHDAPDRAVITFTVETKGRTAAAAGSENARIQAAV